MVNTVIRDARTRRYGSMPEINFRQKKAQKHKMQNQRRRFLLTRVTRAFALERWGFAALLTFAAFAGFASVWCASSSLGGAPAFSSEALIRSSLGRVPLMNANT